MNGRKGQATLRDVAAAAGVSQMTVSRTLNAPSLVREETRSRVLAAVEALDYRPNLAARSLVAGASLFIGLVWDNPSSSYLSELLIGSLDACRARGHHLVLCQLNGEDTDPTGTADRLRRDGLDALILAPPRSDDPRLVSAIRAAGLPYVLVSATAAERDSPAVSIDDEAGGRMATELLISLGHRRIGLLEGPPNHRSSAPRRLGYERALAAANLPFEASLVARGTFSYRSGLEATGRLLAARDRPTAIFASNDDMAAGCCAAAAQAGLSVPTDLSVVGFDDVEIARTVWPPITTVQQPIRQMAAHAVELLTAQPGRVAPGPARLDLSIVERGTHAPPRAG